MNKALFDKKMEAGPRWLFLPLGGAGEIGMNLNLYGYLDENGKESWIIVDIGVTFSSGMVPGIDVIMADIAFLEERADKITAIILTHGHEDHIGAIAYLWPHLKCPIYATKFTAHLVNGKLREAGLEEEVEMHIVEPKKRLKIGAFDIEFVGLTHSIPEPNALAIRTPLGCVLHTGDWKIDLNPMSHDKMDEDRLRAIGKEGVLSMICDSTNVFEEGHSGSESEVYDSLSQLIAQRQKVRIFVASFASNVGRMANVARIAQRNGRRVALLGRSMLRMAQAARENGLFGDIQSFLSPQEAARMPRGQILFLCTGSQGEPRAALRRIAGGRHPDIHIDKDDCVIFSSREIPGNETAIYQLQNDFAQMGAEIITVKQSPMIHVSGHPCRGELAEIYKWVRPRSLIPVHGEYRHLKEHMDFARSAQISSSVMAVNGAVIELAPEHLRHMGFVSSGRIYLDGKILTLANRDGAVKARRALAQSGILSISLILEDNHIAAPIKISLSGAPQIDVDGKSLAALALRDVEDMMGALKPYQLENDDVLKKIIRRAINQSMFHHWGKKPETHIHICRV